MDLSKAKELNIAIIGGGKTCREFIELILNYSFTDPKVNIVGVADIKEDALGFKYAKERGIYTTNDYKDLYKIKDLGLIFELTKNDIVRKEVTQTKPSHIKIVDYEVTSLLWKLMGQMGERIWLYKLNAICAAVGGSLGLGIKDFFKVVSSEIIRIFEVDSISIYLKKDKTLELAYSEGYSQAFYEKPIITRQIEDGLIGKVAQEGIPLIFEDLSDSKTPYLDIILKEGLKSAAYIPLLTNAKVLGVMRVSSHTSCPFSSRYMNFIRAIGQRIGTAIEFQSLCEERYRFLFNANPNPIFIIDRKTLKILDANTRAEEYYGYSRKELLGMPFIMLGCKKDSNFSLYLKDISKGLTVPCQRTRCQKKSGGLFYINVHACMAKYMGKKVMIVETTDVTELIKKEAQLIQAAKMSTLGQMAAGIAHELNQPLTVIKMGNDFFLKTIKGNKKAEGKELHIVAQEVSSQVDRAAEIINHLRNFARVSEVTKKKIDINTPIKGVFKLLGQQLAIHQVWVELDLDEKLPLVLADHNHLEQVFINLVINAKDAMDEKEKKLGREKTNKILRIKSYLENGEVVVSVSDTGLGMPEEVIDKIFEPFFTTKEVGRGTGLGLSISYEIVKEYGGTIDVKTKAGLGTTFMLRFPACFR